MLNTEARRQLQTLLPLEMVATKQWLASQGLSLHFLDNAIRSHTLLPLTAGVYTRLEKNVSWKSVIASLQRMVEHPVHVGGLTALELEGVHHYLTKTEPHCIQLYSCAKPPNWLNRIEQNIELKAHFEWHSTRRLWSEFIMNENKFIRQAVWKEIWHEELPPLIYSCVEKAMLEVLNEVPKTISFEHADELMQGLHNLSPRKLDTLLQHCCNIKVKRLFLWLSQRHHHAWFKHLTPDNYQLGSGKHVIAEGGRLEPRWQITIPKYM